MIEQIEKCFTFEPGESFTKTWRQLDASQRTESELLLIARQRCDVGQVEMHARTIAALDHERADSVMAEVIRFMNEKQFEIEQFEAVHSTCEGRLIHLVVNVEGI